MPSSRLVARCRHGDEVAWLDVVGHAIGVLHRRELVVLKLFNLVDICIKIVVIFAIIFIFEIRAVALGAIAAIAAARDPCCETGSMDANFIAR